MIESPTKFEAEMDAAIDAWEAEGCPELFATEADAHEAEVVFLLWADWVMGETPPVVWGF